MAIQIVQAGPLRDGSPAEGPARETMLLDLALPCPLACVECPRRGARESPAALEVARHRLLSAVHEGGVRELRAVLYGGDPFLAFASVVPLLQEVGAACAGRGVRFEPFAISSGAAVSPEAVRAFHEAGLRCAMVNLAGPRELHDQLRPLRRRGGGSFERVLDGLRLARPPGGAGLELVARLTVGAPDEPAVGEVAEALAAALPGDGPPLTLLVGPPAAYRDQARELLALADRSVTTSSAA